jgi:hypothetical protein
MSKIIIEIDIDGLVKRALQIQDNRAKDIVVRRHGLKALKKYTLASLGSEYGLTRERIRQIEAASLKNIKSRIEKEKEAREFIKLTEDYLERVSKFKRSDLLAKDIWALCGFEDEYDPVFENKLNFIAKVLGRPYIIDATPGMHTVWHIDYNIYDLAVSLIKRLLNAKEHNFDKYLEMIARENKLAESAILNYLSASKSFGIGPYGHMGANHWLYVNPKTVRDKAYLVLSQSDEPMHFKEIARLVNEISVRGKAPATVHNELIRDPRFILVGRGTYSLNE